MSGFENEKLTTFEQAARACNDTRVQYSTVTKEFIVESDVPNGLSAVVKLQPNSFSSMKCSCSGTAICYHIVAAQIAANCTDPSTKGPRNSKALRKKKQRSRPISAVAVKNQELRMWILHRRKMNACLMMKLIMRWTSQLQVKMTR